VSYDVPKPNRLADISLEAAKQGDWHLLDEYLDRGYPMTDALRQDYRRLSRHRSRSRHRPKAAATQVSTLEIAAFRWKAEQDDPRDPTKRTADHFKKSRGTVQAAYRKFEKLEPEVREFVLQARAGKRPDPSMLCPFDDAAPIEGRRATMRRLGLLRK
jgi:hypothetical protein